MKKRFLYLALSALAMTPSVHAAQADHVHASHGWIRVLPGALPAAGYVILQNDGGTAAQVVGVSSPIYAEIMLHQTANTSDGMSSMRMVDHLDVPAHGRAALAPTGYHLMLMQASHPILPGVQVPVILRFADGSVLTANFLARPANAVDDNAR